MKKILVVCSCFIFILIGTISIKGSSNILNDQTINQSFDNIAFAQQPSGLANPRCTDNYTTWNNSLTYNPNAQWSTNFMIINYINGTTTQIANIFNQDINGDGLVDYLYSGTSSQSTCGTQKYYRTDSCVYLNNGKGWTPAYRCVVSCNQLSGSYEVRFYGDCAA